jgi:polysaccharide deacetylase family protein (PEP-CTERM system associated)
MGSRLRADGSGTMAPATIVNAMTIDVEDYYMVSAFESVVARERWHEYESRVNANTDRVLAILEESGVKATFFVLGCVAEREPALVRRIADAGHEIASHGYGHRLVYDQGPEAFREDIRRSKAILQSASGRSVTGYRAPSFSITRRSLWALDILIEEGFVYDASIFPIRHDRYGIPDAPRHPFWVSRGAGHALSTAGPRAGDDCSGAGHDLSGAGLRAGGRLLEIPASTIHLAGLNLPVGGGGYFRLLPCWWTRAGLRRLNAVEGRPAVFYLHPWELDPGQPRLDGSMLSRFRHYRNLGTTEGRLRRLLTEFGFGPIADTILPAASAAA